VVSTPVRFPAGSGVEGVLWLDEETTRRLAEKLRVEGERIDARLDEYESPERGKVPLGRRYQESMELADAVCARVKTLHALGRP
jgi:hypothetical protein